ncbi:MAG: hypothetical protein ACOZCO_03600, partial [Bacteroidota bacterium]
KKMFIDIMVYSRNSSARIVKNKNVPGKDGVFMVSLHKEKIKHGLKDVTGIMIINSMKSVAGKIELHLLVEKGKSKPKKVKT